MSVIGCSNDCRGDGVVTLSNVVYEEWTDKFHSLFHMLSSHFSGVIWTEIWRVRHLKNLDTPEKWEELILKVIVSSCLEFYLIVYFLGAEIMIYWLLYILQCVLAFT